MEITNKWNYKEDNKVGIEKMSVTYVQNPDTNSNQYEYQYFTIESENTGTGADGWYMNISTKDCDHWSICSPNDITELIEDFLKRFNYESISTT